jgi:pyridoxal 5'-phosphate synthase pdxS subunit
MAKCRIGHFVEAQVLQELGIDMIDESEVLTVADEGAHVDKSKFTVPFVCGCRNLGEALRRINEGAAMIRTKGEAGTGDVSEAVRHMKLVNSQIAELKRMDENKLREKANEFRVPFELVKKTKEIGRMPIVNFAAGGIATPADAALMMQLGADGVFVGSGIFKSNNPHMYAKAIVQATENYLNAKIVAKAGFGLGDAMKGEDAKKVETKLQNRGI